MRTARSHFLAQFSDLFHMEWSTLLRRISHGNSCCQNSISRISFNTQSKMGHTMWKSMQNCAENSVGGGFLRRLLVPLKDAVLNYFQRSHLELPKEFLHRWIGFNCALKVDRFSHLGHISTIETNTSWRFPFMDFWVGLQGNWGLWRIWKGWKIKLWKNKIK